MRRRLVAYFRRKRCLSPDDLADGTLTRVARKLEAQGAIPDMRPGRFCSVGAGFVSLEHVRGADRRQTSLDEPRRLVDAALQRFGERDSRADETPLLDVLERCLQQL